MKKNKSIAPHPFLVSGSSSAKGYATAVIIIITLIASFFWTIIGYGRSTVFWRGGSESLLAAAEATAFTRENAAALARDLPHLAPPVFL